MKMKCAKIQNEVERDEMVKSFGAKSHFTVGWETWCEGSMFEAWALFEAREIFEYFRIMIHGILQGKIACQQWTMTEIRNTDKKHAHFFPKIILICS